jgi:UDP-2,3-diacylglucosamine hydrolase
MKIAAISDVHVKSPRDEADQLLCQFLTHPETTSSDYVFLLGDIFDLMCGPHANYLKNFSHLFELIDRLVVAGKKVYYFEGNHDVHLEMLFGKFWPGKNFIPFQQPVVLSVSGKSYYISHGDEHDVTNLSYQRYKRFILSPPLRWVANYLIPYAVLHFIGERASKHSRKRGYRQFNEAVVRDRFRQGVMKTTLGKYDFVLGGHSHVQDMAQLDHGLTYINNGFALKTKSFVVIENHQPRFQNLM